MRHKFYDDVTEMVAKLGGFHNAHLHMDRSHTLDEGFVDHGKLSVLNSSHISLQKKHALIATVHESLAYKPDNLKMRLGYTTDEMVKANTKTADTMIDVTNDCLGVSALELALEFAKSRKSEIDIRCASYTPLGFKDSEPGQWNVFEEGVKLADFIGCLPEADDKRDYPDNIGFEEHIHRMLDLVQQTGKMLHVHTDQLNTPTEDGTERLIKVMRSRNMAPVDANGDPLVWAVHMISPSTYDDPRWQKFVDGLMECNIGVISCPSAAIGMRQFRPINTPTYNSIPRILELVTSGVRVRLGSDNVADMCSPSTTENLMDEVFVLSAAIRYFEPVLLAKLACGVAVSQQERDVLAEHLRLNDVEIEKRI